MKKFILFASETYYASGGMGDMQGSFDSLEEAENEFHENEDGIEGWDWFEIVDRDSWKFVLKDVERRFK